MLSTSAPVPGPRTKRSHHEHTLETATGSATEKTSRPGGPSRGLRRLATLIIGLASALAMTMALAGPANAYVTTAASGRTGPIHFSPATGGTIVALSNYRFTTPSLIVYRNGAIAATYQQELQVNTSLQRWDGYRWVQTAGQQQRVLITMGTDGSALVDGSTLQSQVRAAGYFRVVTTVRWGSASALPYWSGVYTGVQQFVPSYTADMRCAIAACQNRVVSNGSLYVWGWPSTMPGARSCGPDPPTCTPRPGDSPAGRAIPRNSCTISDAAPPGVFPSSADHHAAREASPANGQLPHLAFSVKKSPALALPGVLHVNVTL